jgi:N6-adenosine-specific RNA methylase IME4
MGDLDGLARSIREVGLLHPIVITPSGELIAGCRRLQACKILGWNQVPVTRVPLKEIATGEFHENFVRKDFTVSEMVAIKHALEKTLAERVGRPRKSGRLPEIRGDTRDIVGRYVGVSGKTLEKAEAIVRAATSSRRRFAGVLERVNAGSTSVEAAYTMVRRFEFQKMKTPPLPDGRYDVILADPPWDMGPASLRGSPNAHYPTMTPAQISTISPPSHQDAVLFLWCVPSGNDAAFEVMDAWGFDYKTQLVWVKDRFGTGYYFRIQHELLLLGTRGTMGAPLEHDRPSSVLMARRGRHSEKPEEVHSIIEKMYPRRRYLELFARKRHPGWESWGNQLEEKADSRAYPQRTYVVRDLPLHACLFRRIILMGVLTLISGNGILIDPRNARETLIDQLVREVLFEKAEEVGGKVVVWPSIVRSVRPRRTLFLLKPFLYGFGNSLAEGSFPATVLFCHFDSKLLFNLVGNNYRHSSQARPLYARVSVCLNNPYADKTYEHTSIQGAR